MSYLQRKWLFDKLHYEQRSISELSKAYNISKGALYRIKQDRRLITKPVGTRNIFKLSTSEEQAIIKCIRDFLENCTFQFNASDVCKHILLKLGRSLPLSRIRKLLKETFHLSYKRIYSRPCYIDIDRIQLTRILFSICLSNIIDSGTLLINIDEASITQDTKFNYSWTPIGKNSEVWNKRFATSLNIVFAICSNGSWLEMLSNNTLTTDRFIIFLRNLKTFLEENNYFEFKRIVILLDNLPSHRTDKVVDMLLKWSFDICYIPPYSPSLAPVELTFGRLKRKLTQKQKEKWINLSNYEGYSLVVLCMKEIDAKVILNWFSHFYREVKENLSILSYLC